MIVNHTDGRSHETFGLTEAARTHLEKLSGSPPEVSYRISDDKGPWRQTKNLSKLLHRQPMYITTTWSVPDKGSDQENARLHIAAGVWLDIDARAAHGETVRDAVEALGTTVARLEWMGIDPEQCNLFASGGKGFHVYIPLDLMLPRGVEDVGLLTARNWPRVCKEFVLCGLDTHLTDKAIYSGGLGRLFRQANVQRASGLYKVPLAWNEWRGLSEASYKDLCSEPRPAVEPAPVNGIAPRAAEAWNKARAKSTKPAAPQRRATRHTDAGGRLLACERRRIEQALAKLGELEYGDWLRVGCALKSTGAAEALELWETWSRRFPKHRAGECESRWTGLGSTAVSLGTLYHLAAKGGKA
jgi:hypothetical protein